MSETGRDWGVIGEAVVAWFDAPSLSQGAALAERVVELSPTAAVDVRATGVRVRLDTNLHTGSVSAAAHELGLSANPSGLQQLGVVLESADPLGVGRFWQRVLDYVPETDGLVDPLRRDPAVRIQESTTPRQWRQRLHLDVVRPAAIVRQTGLGDGSGPYGVRHVDPDGTEVDLVPGAPLGEQAGVADWQAVFSAMACYRVTSSTQQVALARAAAGLAEANGFPLLVDLRPGLVIMESGKDQWEKDAHGLALDFAALAAELQSAADELGAVADPQLPRLVQLFFDAADVEAVRAFWVAALGYTLDRRAGLTDIYDPHRLNPVLAFQELDASETERRRERNRIHLELALPADLVDARVATVVDAGGRIIDRSENRCLVADPEGNELMIFNG